MTLRDTGLVLAGGWALSCALTMLVRHIALKGQMLDVPNERSSHTRPTPRGGGLAIVISFLGIVGLLALIGDPIPAGLASALLGGGAIVALVGFIDDRSHLSARTRFAAHLAAAAWALWAMGGIPPLTVFGWSINQGWPGFVLAVVYLVWLINLYNFMDGIDGIASIEAILVSLGGALTWWLASGTSVWFIPVLFAACVAGFLMLNYPPAKIFMGDAGSGFIGMVLGIFSLWVAQKVPLLFWCWPILLGGFVVDATMTLIRRVLRGDRFHEAHRNHAYQYASRKHKSHERVSLAFAAIACFWLLPVAVLVALKMLDGIVGVLIAYTPLILLALRYKAGARSAQEV
jgi:glycosyltransferase WbpL